MRIWIMATITREGKKISKITQTQIQMNRLFILLRIPKKDAWLLWDISAMAFLTNGI